MSTPLQRRRLAKARHDAQFPWKRGQVKALRVLACLVRTYRGWNSGGYVWRHEGAADAAELIKNLWGAA